MPGWVFGLADWWGACRVGSNGRAWREGQGVAGRSLGRHQGARVVPLALTCDGRPP